MYIVRETSIKSENEAYDRTIEVLKYITVEMASIMLERYYSFLSYIAHLGNTKVYIMRNKSSTLNGSRKWNDTMIEFV